MKIKKKALYLSYTGMLEPLGRSQVLSYLTRLSNGYSFTLISFEKSSDILDKQAVGELHNECLQHGIIWKPQIYHHRPRFLATVWDLLVLVWLTLIYSVKREVCLVHCRSYVPAMAAWLCGKITRKPFIFDMRALWPDEMVSAGRLGNESLIYKILKRVEGRLLRDAGAVVSLTEAAVEYLIEVHPTLGKNKFHVITTCVDLTRFEGIATKPIFENKQVVIGTMGTVLSGWFHLSWFFTFFLEVQKRLPVSVLKIVTKDDHNIIIEQARAFGIAESRIIICSCNPNEIPDFIADFTVAVMFFVSDVGKLGSAPTRLGEFLAAGIPIVGNKGIGDMGELIENYRVGVVVQGGETDELSHAADRLIDYLKVHYDPNTCRAAAEDYFSADKGAERYRAIYRQIENTPGSLSS